jgi:hypothetical protein
VADPLACGRIPLIWLVRFDDYPDDDRIFEHKINSRRKETIELQTPVRPAS